MMKKIILAFICTIFVFHLKAQDFTGDWYGILEAGKAQIPIVFHISADGETYTTTLDSPSQGAKGIPMDETIVSKDQLKVVNNAAQLSYSGKYDKKTNTIDGTFKQGPGNLPLKLSREEKEKKIIARKQEPIDFPYQVEEVKIQNEKTDVTLSGTLTLPRDIENMTSVVILISGSGAQDRNADLGVMNHRPFLVWSDYLTRNGIGVLRYDDRGTAKSTGDFQKATSADFSEDAEAVFEYLKSREDLKDVKIGLMGHSEGGMIAPMVAARNKKVDFVVLLAGPGVPNNELLLKQKLDLAKAAFLPKEIIDADQIGGKKIFDYINEFKDLDDESFITGLREIVQANVADYHPMLKGGKSDEVIVESEVKQYMSPWFRYFITYNPTENLTKVKCPLLAVNGTLDLQVSNDENLAAIEVAMKESKNPEYKITSYKGLNHLFQTAETGDSSEYGNIEETVNEDVMKDVMNWIFSL